MAAPAERIDRLKLAEGEGGESGGVEGGEPRLGGGERRISLLSLQSRRSSILFLRFLGFFMGGWVVSGDSVGIIGCGIETPGGWR